MAADVESLYTNIDIDEGVRKIKALLLAFKLADMTKATLIQNVLEWVLKNNYFLYNNNWYRQVKGTAMGTNCAPAYANLFLAFHEEKWMRSSIWNPSFYNRFIDDIVAIVPDCKMKQKELINMMNSTTKSLKFTFELNDKEIPFLDLKIFKGTEWVNKNELSHKLYDKPINKHIYTCPSSYAPYSWKFSWITGENIRMLRNSSTKQDFDESINSFIKYLQVRNYPMKIINKMIKYSFEDRNIFLTSSLNTLRQRTRKPNTWFISVKNIPGRHLIVSALKDTLKNIKKYYDEEYWLDIPEVLIYRGDNLMDYCNKSNKKVLLGSRQLSDETDPKTLGDREEPRENTFINGYPKQSVKDPIDTIYNNADEPIGAKRTLNYGPVMQGFKRTNNYRR